MTSPTAYPLSWPARVPRAKQRKRANFSRRAQSSHGSWTTSRELTLSDALGRLLPELSRLGAKNVVVSTNVELRRDGLPYSGRRAPDDPGVAVYFDLKGAPHCMPCDKWNRVPDNVAAIAGHVEALRKIDRYGVQTIEEAFTGFRALPAAGEGAGSTWWSVLGLDAPTSDADLIRKAFRSAVRRTHPDVDGGSAEAFHEVQEAFKQAQAAGGGQ